MQNLTDSPVVGIVEIAAALNVQRATVDQWRQRGILPAAPWQVGGRPAWPRHVLDDLAHRDAAIAASIAAHPANGPRGGAA